MIIVFMHQLEDRQTVMMFANENAVPIDLRLIPLLLSSILMALQLSHAALILYRRWLRNNQNDTLPSGSDASQGDDGSRSQVIFHGWKRGIQKRGGSVIFGFMVARLLCTLLLLYLFSRTNIEGYNTTTLHGTSSLHRSICTQEALTLAIAYAALLSILSFWPSSIFPSPVRFHVSVLLSLLGVYAYRNVWPLAQYGTEPADNAEGAILWVKIALLSLLAIVIPLFIPHPYVPLDHKNPSPTPNPEQTASWFSALTYTYMDPLIKLANKVRHLKHDQLPPLADYDCARYLSGRASRFVDPFPGARRRRHIFFGLVAFFRYELVIIFVGSVIHALATFVAPIGINRTLRYLENRDNHTTTASQIKPWVWPLLMLIGPVGESAVKQWNSYVQTKVRVRVQAVMMQAFFERGLCVRVKADAGAEMEAGSETGREGERTTSPVDSGSVSGGEHFVGRINNLVTSDLQSIAEGCDFPSFLIVVTLQIALSIVFLYNILGWAAFAGLFTTLALTPVVGFIGKKIQDVQVTKMKLTDARVQSISEAVGILRMIKLFGWERQMTEPLERKRDEELGWLWAMKKLALANDCASILAPTLSMLMTYGTYTIIMGQELTASKIFSSMAVELVVREQVARVAGQYTLVIEAKVSLDRANSFLQESELLDRYLHEGESDLQSSTNSSAEDICRENGNEGTIGFKDAVFTWSADSEDRLSSSDRDSQRSYKLRIDGELVFKRNCINLIVGPTGSGKTSMLMALLGEMHYIPGNSGSWYNLPRQGGVAYASQETWVQNATIRENIVFGYAFDEKRYKKVLNQCALERDLELFDAGDETEVGERGLTLSGGQKARVTLARAIYSSAEIILLDDVLAALDVHTAVWIVNKCFCGDLVKGRTVLLVTHNVALVSPIAEMVVTLGSDGSISSHSRAINNSDTAHPETVKGTQYMTLPPPEKPTDALVPSSSTNPAGKLVMAEEIVEGHITWRSMKLLLSALGGRHPTLFGVLWIGGLVLCEATFMMQPWFLGVWGAQYEKYPASEVRLWFYLSVFSSILGAGVLIYAGVNYYFSSRSIEASKVIHYKLADAVFRSTLRWLDETPTARIITRFTQDIQTVDEPIPHSLMWVGSQFIGMLGTLGGIVLFSPVFVFPGVAVAVLGIYVGNLYMRAQLSIKREMSNARAPLLAHFGATIQGLVSIRAYGMQKAFREVSFDRIDHYSRTARTSWTINRWIGFRIDALGALFTSALALYLVYGSNISASNTGFSLTLGFGFTLYIFWLIRVVNDLEVESNSLERIQGYIDIDQEPKPTSSGLPPASWPTSGDIRVEGLSAQYSQTGPRVLHNLSFHISSGQRIGVVGRTGSGKSSLTLALLRCILTEGTVFFDGIATGTLNLDVLRSNITIIPQTPELLSGTLRQNLDPFGQNDDATLNDALRAAGLFSLQEEAGEVRLTLDSKIAGGGNNLSVGQRQIIALARAMVRGSKLLILDEATSAIDYKTDAVIQSTLRSKLGADVTVITVAHRLQTIMDADKIMVLESGKIVEFDTPSALLQYPQGILRALVDESKDKILLNELTSHKL
ncbi:ATP-binding cassette transporter abc4 [Psilocybe cubensis]|uniref:P-loop containing nucleoside triphosphate hydrolase protein n=2 Tax=Psilocybe cubensis TaxID=181762 RepID=A0A8H7XSR8_PSICU|nr:ATP-binding cassette transporter abc4 [Psilocybe cubensis]KAH9480765.1 ATP-binding cassette transporter abc4 [Psilocybe cubensis]